MAKMKTLTVSGQTYTVQDPEAVSFTAQNLTPQQQAHARQNIGVEEAALYILVSFGLAPVLLDGDGSVLADGDGAVLLNHGRGLDYEY